ncbi:MAG: membrane protein insertase YidC [Paracoccaceae bacterium]
MDDQNKNLILATALSFGVILIWFVLFPPPEPPVNEAPTEVSDTASPSATPSAAAPAASGGTPAAAGSGNAGETEQLAADAPRVDIDSPSVEGSLSLKGGRIDTLSLKNYRETLDPDSDIVHLLNPVGERNAYQILYGWAPGGGLDFADVPGPNTLWSVAEGDELTPDSPITLAWDNGKGLVFNRVLEIDDKFMITVTQSVTNNGDTAQRLAPEGRIERFGLPDDLKGFFILHEGAIRKLNEEREEIKYSNMEDLDAGGAWAGGSVVADVQKVDADGWIGFTDHFWMTTLIPASDQAFTSVLQYDSSREIYRAIARLDTVDVAPGETVEVSTRLFAGAKEWEAIRNYQRFDGVSQFIDSIDWGWFYFLTKPIFWVLHNIQSVIGNMGWSIIVLTLFLKALLLPLAFKSYVSMAKMKELQPEMEKLKEQAGDDRQKLQKGMMELYKKEKVNPAAGCLPILLQIPIFFSLYKVIFVTIELRHAAWFGPFQDLSAPDPTSIMNFFGLFPWAGPEPATIMATIFLGILPLLLGISMWLQQKLNPAPTDPTQQMIFAWMPWVFMFMLGGFASGLVVYWIANNVITFIQQYAIMRSQGYTPDVFGNIKSSFKKKKPEAEKK